MKRNFGILVFLLTFTACLSSIRAQDPTPVPSPAPVIYKAPDKSILKRFEPADKSFAAVFPGQPAEKRSDEKDVKQTTIQTYMDGSHSIVNIFEYGADIESRRSSFYDSIKSNILKMPKTVLDGEREVRNGQLNGKEFAVSSDLSYQQIRVFAKGKRIFIVGCDVANWRMLKDSYKDKVSEFKTECQRFMDSFVIKK